MAKKGKGKISKVKRNNHTTNKMKKAGTLKTRRHRPKQPQKPRDQQSLHDPPSDPESESDGVNDMVDEEDMEYFRSQIKKNSGLLSSVPQEADPVNSKKPKPLPGQKKRKRRTSASDDEKQEAALEQQVQELRPTKKMRPLLPIKTKDGIVARADEKEESDSEPEEDQVVEKQADSDEEEAPSDNESDTGQDVLADQDTLTAADLLLARKAELQDKKFRIGTLCSGLLESPEKKLKNFYPLFTMMDAKGKDDTENLVSVRKLATISIYEVFKDILPEYMIKHQDYTNIKLKKDTLHLYKFEKEQLEFYKRYLQRLEKAANSLRQKKGDSRKMDIPTKKLGFISLQCMCGMMAAKPYFNFATNICQTVVPYLNNGDPKVRKAVSDCCKSIFSEDKKGEITLTIVRRINALVKSRSHNVRSEALTCLLALRIKDVDLDKEKSIEIKQKHDERRKKRLINLSKKEKKRKKKLAEVEKEMLETEAEESKVLKQKNLMEITTTLFTIYFRILKSAPNSKLLSATLHGLSRFAHVINLEYYSDLVSILGRLLQGESLGRRERLHCVQTVFSILSGQGDALNIDPTNFYAYLYDNVLQVHVGKSHEDLPIILEAMTHVLIRRARKVSQGILLAYVKRLMTLALQVQHNGALACLAIVRNVAQNAKSVDILLNPEESIGSGFYQPLLREPEHCAAHATALYEVAHLRRHYHPTVRSASERLLNYNQAGSSPIDRLSAQQLFKEYDGSQMAFKPSIPMPEKNTPKKKISTHHIFTVPSFEEYCNKHLDSVNLNVDFTKVLSKTDT